MSKSAPPVPPAMTLRNYLSFFHTSRRAIQLVWQTNKALTIGLAIGSLLMGLLPGTVAWVGKHLVDAVVTASHAPAALLQTARHSALVWVGREMALVIGLAIVARTMAILRSLLRQQLGQRINMIILEKALTLELTQFEDSDLYDKMTRARRDARAPRPLSLS